jgi:hypothetical protein
MTSAARRASDGPCSILAWWWWFGGSTLRVQAFGNGY